MIRINNLLLSCLDLIPYNLELLSYLRMDISWKIQNHFSQGCTFKIKQASLIRSLKQLWIILMDKKSRMNANRNYKIKYFV